MSKILTLSKKAIIDLIIEQEVSSEVYYKAKLQSPVWPGGHSGITVGLGYDVGTQTPLQIQKDFAGILTPKEVERLMRYAGKTGEICKTYVPLLKDFKMEWFKACKLFYQTSLRRYARSAAGIYPQLETLHPYEQTAIVGLVYNRGTALKGDSRKEMALLVQAIIDDNDKTMAGLIRAMKRLWANKGLNGLLTRRELEADWVEMVDTPIEESDKLLIEI